MANPPFAVVAAILRRLVSPGSRLVSADLVVPRPVAGRWANGRGPGVGRWGGTFAARHVVDLPRHAFHPAPPGAIAVLRVERRA